MTLHGSKQPSNLATWQSAVEIFISSLSGSIVWFMYISIYALSERFIHFFSFLQKHHIQCSFKNLTVCQSKIVENRRGLPSKLFYQGLKIHLPKSRSRHHFPLKSEDAILDVFQKPLFSQHMHLTVSRQYVLQKTVNSNTIQWPLTASQNHPALKTSRLQ